MTHHETAQHITIHTDGSCSPNPGPGGYAAVLRRMDGKTQLKRKIIKGFEPRETTSVRMEMIAVLKALEFLKPAEPQPIHIYSDNDLVANGITRWLQDWIGRGWRTAQGKPVQNVDLWQAIVAATKGKRITWNWVKSHAGDPMNEQADHIARRQMEIARDEVGAILFAV